MHSIALGANSPHTHAGRRRSLAEDTFGGSRVQSRRTTKSLSAAVRCHYRPVAAGLAHPAGAQWSLPDGARMGRAVGKFRL